MSISAENNDMINKILKLLELGKEETNENRHQRDAANAKAAELMAKHSIDFADLRTGKSVNGIFSQFDLVLDGDPVDWQGSLANSIAEAFDVRVVQRNNPWTLMYCGTKIDMEIAVFFFKHLRRAVGLRSSRSFPKKADQKNFAFGMITEIDRRLRDLYQKRNEALQSDGRALMVVKTDALEKFVKEKFPKLTHKKVNLTGSREAHNAGIQAGKEVNLSRPIGHSGKNSNQSISALKH